MDTSAAFGSNNVWEASTSSLLTPEIDHFNDQ